MSVPTSRHPTASWPAWATAEAALKAAGQRAGFDPTNARLIRLMDSAVFELPRHRVIARVALAPELGRRAHNAIAAARVLSRHGVPVVQPAATRCDQPVCVDGAAVTFWRQEPRTYYKPGLADLGMLLTRLHRLPADVPLPGWDPLDDLRAHIDAVRRGDPDDLDFLLGRCEEAAAGLAGLRYQLPSAVIHGDAEANKVILSPAGPVLCGLDHVCVGPTEWDLVPVAVAALRFGGMAAHHELAFICGADVTEWDGFEVLRLVRELELVTAGLRLGADNPSVRAEARRRLRTLRAGDTSARWTRYR